MRQIKRSALVAATPQRLFELINDINRYPEFVPGCVAAEVLESSPTEMRARLTVGSGALKASFVTRNRLTPHHEILMELDEGPFKSLNGIWTLTPVIEPGSDVAAGCRVALDMSFDLGNRLKDMALGPMVERTAAALVDAFVSRAKTKQT
jgi:ribosome-associated toxin RatA of RatAB toxin-antitoxin module